MYFMEMEIPSPQTVFELKQMTKRYIEREFGVERCVFVGDRGMVTKKNLTLLAEAGYPYIVGYHKRDRVVSDALLKSYADVQSYAQLKDNLYYLEVPAAGVDDEDENKDKARYILCYNPTKAVQDKAFRDASMEEAEKALSELQ